MRARFFTTAGSCRCDANSPKRPSKIFGGPEAPACASIAAAMPFCAANPECRNFDCVPSTQHSSSPAAVLPAMPAAQAIAARVETEQLPGRVGDAERREEPGGMKAAAVERARRHRPDAAGDLVADRDRHAAGRGR